MEISTLALLIALIQTDDAFNERLLDTIPERAANRELQVRFGPYGKIVSYTSGTIGDVEIVVNGKKVAEGMWGEPPEFSRDGEHYAFMAGGGSQSTLYHDGVRGEAFDKIFGCPSVGWKPGVPFPALSDDGIILAYAGRQGKTTYIVRGGEKTAVDFRQITEVGVSPDGKIVAYGAENNRSEYFMVVGEKTHGPYKKYAGCPAWNADSSSFAFVAGTKEGSFVVHDGRQGQFFSSISKAPVISPDGKIVAYPAQKGREKVLVIGDDIKTGYYYYQRPVFSPDSKRVAYVGQNDNEFFFNYDDLKSGPFDGISHTVFSADSNRVAVGVLYRSGLKLKWRMLVDHEPYGEFDDVGPAQFSADGKRLAFGARVGRELWWKVIELE